MSQTQSPLDPYRSEISSWFDEKLSTAEVIEAIEDEFEIKTSERSVRRARKRWEVEPEPSEPLPVSTSIRGDEADLVSRPSAKLNTEYDLMRERGLDPEEWEVVSMTINEWESATKKGGGQLVTGKQTLKQLKIHLRRKVPIELIVAARIDGPVYIAKPQKVGKNLTRRVVLVGDQQAPYNNEQLHEAFCDFLFDYNPHEGVLIGDTIDLPDISRHPNNPEKDATSQECVDSGYAILRDYREANNAVNWKKLAGNHDERVRRLQIDKVERLYGMRRAQVPGEIPEIPVMDVGHLLRLDELDIEYVRPKGDYEHEQINLSPYLAARHGWIARKGSGASALATLEQLGYSVVVGHTHRQSLVHKTRHDINGALTTVAACETGCMCRVEDGLGYTVAPDWQNGFATAEIWSDGTFNLNLATFVNGTLYYRDKRY